MEAAGTVIDVGAGVSGLLPGDRVAYLGPVPGAYCSVRTVPADWVVRLPAAVEDDAAAALLLKGITADFLLRDLGHVAGTRLLVHAAAGGVGLLVCAWARRLGAVVLGTGLERGEGAGRARARLRARDRHRRLPFRRRRAARCGGADVIVDGLGDAARDENLAALARRGHWISLGQASGFPLAPLAGRAGDKSATFSRPVVFDYTAGRGQLAERDPGRGGTRSPAAPAGAADRAPFARRRGAGARAARIAFQHRRADPDHLRTRGPP